MGPLASVDDALESHADALAANPFLDRHPVLLDGLTADAAHPGFVRNRHGRLIAHTPAFLHDVHLLAVTGSQSCALMGEWDGRTLLPLGVWHGGRPYDVDGDFLI